MQQQPMFMKNPQDEYRKQGVLTASPVELIVMLYDGLKKDLFLAQRAIEKKDAAAAHTYLIKAQNIVAELADCLDLSLPISKDLMSFYEYILHSLEVVNIQKDATLIEPLLEMIGEMRETWSEVASTQKGSMSLEE